MESNDHKMGSDRSDSFSSNQEEYDRRDKLYYSSSNDSSQGKSENGRNHSYESSEYCGKYTLHH